jgi:shikimate kinase
LNFDLVTRDQQNLHLVLTAYIDTLVQRLRQDELSHDNPLPKRPILNPTQAQKLQQLFCLFDKDPEIQKEILIKEIIEDSITVFLQRKPKYEQLSQHLIATDFLSPEELVEQIYQKINN